MQSAATTPEGVDPPLGELIPFPHRGPVVALDAEPLLELELGDPNPDLEDEVTVRWTDLGTKLTGGVVTDPDEIAAIRRRVQAHAAGRGAWRRRLRMIRRAER